MTRCLICNGILKRGETACYACGERVPKKAVGPTLRKRFSTLMGLVFLGSLVLTGASLFFSDYTPPFTGCLTASVVLLFVKRSTDQFTSAKS